MWKVNMKATGLSIKQKCTMSGYDPKKLSEVCNVTLTTPYLWFNGEMLPKPDNLVTLSKLCGCTIDELLVAEEVEEV